MGMLLGAGWEGLRLPRERGDEEKRWGEWGDDRGRDGISGSLRNGVLMRNIFTGGVTHSLFIAGHDLQEGK